MSPLDTFRELVWDNLVAAALSSLYAAHPILGWGPIRMLIEYVVDRFGDALYGVLKEFMNLREIAFNKAEDRALFDKASVTLLILEREKGLESKEYKNAREHGKQTLAKVIDLRARRAA